MSLAPSSYPLRHDLFAALVPHRQRVDRTTRARAQQTRAIHGLRRAEDGDIVAVEYEGIGRRGHAIAKPDAQRTIDAHAQPVDDALRLVAHIPSSPSSSRARSITAGVISAIARSRA